MIDLFSTFLQAVMVHKGLVLYVIWDFVWYWVELWYHNIVKSQYNMTWYDIEYYSALRVSGTPYIWLNWSAIMLMA